MSESTAWRKSSHSGQQNNCVELAVRIDGTDIRDTKARAAGTLALSPENWISFLKTIKDGELG